MNSKCKPQSKKTSTGDSILSRLAAADSWLSGEFLAETLGVTRAAVAKHVSALRKSGHVIASVTNRGYRLLVQAEPISFSLVEPLLRTKVLGRTGWRSLAETTSTNTDAITWALSGAPEGSVVTAETQTMGKGRKGREWFSSPHALQFSVILRPEKEGLGEKAVTASALEALSEAVVRLASLEVRIKMPNDLYCDGRKLGGVLLESGRRAGEPDWLAVGIGCNVNVPPDAFPDSIRDKVASLYEISGKTVSRNVLLAHILNGFESKLRHVRK